MGLDNGIIIKNYPNQKINMFSLKSKAFDNERREIEIAYWRKCWGIRNDILSILDARFSDEYEIQILKEHIPNIITLLKWYIKNDENWTYTNSIWERRECLKSMKIYIKNLKWAYKNFDKYDLKIYFYDSY